MSTTNPSIPAETARHVLWQYGRPGGVQPGSFTEYLMAAISSADLRNREILRADYPALFEALQMARYDKQGIAKLQRIAAGQGPLACTCGNTAGPHDLKTGRCETCTEAAA